MDILGDLGFGSGSDFSLSDPFKTGGEGASFPQGLNLSGGGAPGAQFPAGISGADFKPPDMSLPQMTGLPGGAGDSGGGLLSFAKGLTGRGEDPGSPRQPGGGGSILGDVFGAAGGLARTGLGAFGVKNQLDAARLAKGQAGQLGQMQQIQRESAQPLQQFGTTQLSRATAGQVDPAVQQMLDNLVNSQKMQAKQWFASQGITDSTMMESVLRDIDNKAEAMKAQVLGMDKQTAIQALSQAMQGATAGAQTASQEQQALDSLIAESNKALAALTGSVG